VSYDEVLRWYADIYSAHFTVDEIHQIRDFYLSPVGEKLVRLRPAMAQETRAKILSIMAQRTPVATRQK